MATLGILGGLGPAASCMFYDMLIRMCPAKRDQDHPDIILYSKASIPDRTAFLLSPESRENPLPAMQSGVKALAAIGAEVIAIPCATAHHFYHDVQASVDVPILNMLALTAQSLARAGVTKAALLATEGTYRSGAFCKTLEAQGVTPLVPGKNEARALMDMIYSVKSGYMPDNDVLHAFAAPLLARGAQRVILGCTELGLFTGLDENIYVNPMKILAEELLCRLPMS